MSPNTAITTVVIMIIGSLLIRSEPVHTEQINQTTSMEIQQDDQRNTDPLILSHNGRDKLIGNLNRFSSILLANKSIPMDAKYRICKKIDESIRLLVELSSFKRSQSTNASGVFEDSLYGQLAVELSKAETLRVAGHLMAVRDAVQFDR